MIRLEHVTLALGLPLLFSLQRALDAHPGEEATVLVTLPPRRILPALAVGHGGAAADLLEIRAVNYVFQNLVPGRLLERDVVNSLYGGVSALDPHDPAAVRRGAIMLGALSDRPEAALALIERGLAAVPPEHRWRWHLYWEQAALHLTSLPMAEPEARDVHIRRAGQLLLEMARQLERARPPGAPDPEQVRAWGLRLTNRGLSPLQALQQEVLLWEERVTEGEGPVKERAAERLAEARSRLGREQLQARVDSFQRQTGQLPARLDELGEVPDDPLGAGYYLHEGRVLAPAAEARQLERRLEKAWRRWQEAGGSGTPRRIDLGLSEGELPPWIEVELGPDRARVGLDLRAVRPDSGR